MNEKEKAFLADIAEVMCKHGVKLGEMNHYDNEETFCGTSSYFTGPGIWIGLDSIGKELPQDE